MGRSIEELEAAARLRRANHDDKHAHVAAIVKPIEADLGRALVLAKKYRTKLRALLLTDTVSQRMMFLERNLGGDLDCVYCGSHLMWDEDEKRYAPWTAEVWESVINELKARLPVTHPDEETS